MLNWYHYKSYMYMYKFMTTFTIILAKPPNNINSWLVSLKQAQMCLQNDPECYQ